MRASQVARIIPTSFALTSQLGALPLLEAILTRQREAQGQDRDSYRRFQQSREFSTPERLITVGRLAGYNNHD